MADEKLVTTADFNLNAPGDGHAVIVTDDNANDVITNLNQAGDFYASLECARGFMHNLGASGNYLRCNSALVRLLHGGNTWMMTDDNNGAGSEATYDVLIDLMQANSEVHLTSSTGAQHADSLAHRIRLERGIGYIEGPLILDSNTIVSVGAGGATLKALVESDNGTAIPWLVSIGGNIESNRTVARAYVAQGTMVQQTSAINYLEIGPGGTVKYWHTAATVIEVQAGGHLDLREKRRQRTITYIIVRKGGQLSGYEASKHVGTLIDER